MAHRIHSSARKQSLPQLTFASNFYNNPFINKKLLQRRYSATETEDCLSALSKDEHLETENHIHELGEVIIKPSKFQLVLDVLELCPEDLRVRAFRKGFFVSAAHKDILEDGREYITNHFYREYILPRPIDPKDATAWITTENMLFIEAPKLPDNTDCDSDSHDDDDDEDEPRDTVDVEIIVQ